MNESPDRFHPSGIAIHPQTDDIYIIGSKDIKMIVCYGMDGNWKGAWELDKHHFLQPEGITFLNSGELVICSEGKKGKKPGSLHLQETINPNRSFQKYF